MSGTGHASAREPSGSVLLTGATGFVGMEVLARYLERSDRDVVCLVRARDDSAASERLESVLHNLFGRGADRYIGRVRALAGELSAPGLGLSSPAREQLAENVTTIVHSAASVSFAMPLDEARAVNVEGTRRMLEFAELARARGAGLDRYAQVSTAYVAGTFDGRFSEGDLDVGQDFHNSYEQSKFEAERLVREVGDDLPWMILRPSIVVGDSRSGWTAAFNVLYWPLRAFSAGLLKVLPSTPEAPLDVVSIDYVADAIHALCESPGPGGETFHLTAGADAGTIGELAVQASNYFRREPPPVVSPEEFAAGAGGISKAALESSRVYFPYFSIRTVFDNALTRSRLAPSGIQASPLHDYLPRLLDFATRSRWGKRPIARAEAQLP
jgi:thioester reductase-like protein